jgi:biotin operon repressor
MGRIGQLRGVEDRLIKELEETTLSILKLGTKYGVSKQAISQFCHQKGIKRPKRTKRPKINHSETCLICQSLIRIAKKPRSEFISSQTLKEKLGLKTEQWIKHIRILRKTGLISQRFGRLHSKKVELAYQIYFKERLPVAKMARQVGLKNLYRVLGRHRALGWDVPDPLFTYDSNDRKKTIARMNRKNRE